MVVEQGHFRLNQGPRQCLQTSSARPPPARSVAGYLNRPQSKCVPQGIFFNSLNLGGEISIALPLQRYR